MPAIPLAEAPDINAQDSIDEELRFCYPNQALREEVEEIEREQKLAVSSQVTRETEQRLREENTAAVRGFRFENQEGLECVRLGHPLRDFDFLRRLSVVIPARFTHLNRPGVWRIECLRATGNGGVWEFATGLQAGMIPEYSTFYFDAHGLPTSEMYRGWRTSLLTLIQKGFVTEQQADRAFGRATGPESWRYRQNLYELRNRRI